MSNEPMAHDGMSCVSWGAGASTSMVSAMDLDDGTTMTDDVPATQNTSFNQDGVIYLNLTLRPDSDLVTIKVLNRIESNDS